MHLNTSQVLSLPSYYLHVLLKRLDILLPLALTLSIPHTYHALHNLGQITLLRLNGYSTFSLLKPALCVCTAMTLILSLHSAYVYPYNHHAITKFEHKAFHKAPPVLQRIISLSDSQLFYSGTYPHLQQAYWVHKEKIDYIDTLNIQENLSHGTSITTFIKKNGHFIKTNYQKKATFPSLCTDILIPLNLLKPYEELNLSELHTLLTKYPQLIAQDKTKIDAIFWKKVLFPLCLLIFPAWGIMDKRKRSLSIIGPALGFVVYTLLYSLATPLSNSGILNPIVGYTMINIGCISAFLLQFFLKRKYIFSHRTSTL